MKKKLFTSIVVGVPRRVVMAALAPLEQRLLAAAEPIEDAIFVIGPPRSGTTLAFELLVTRYRFAYISNLAHRLCRVPAAATRLGRGWIADWLGDFTSDRGVIRGWGSPNEGGWVWNRWLPDATTPDAARVEALPVDRIRRTAGAMSAYLDGAFLSKNVMHSVQMLALTKIFPRSTFIEIRRDPVDNARSILRLREAEHGLAELERWVSVRPDGWRGYDSASPVEQAVAQIFLTREQIARDAARVGAERLHRVDYETLCREPLATIDGVREFLRRRGVELSERCDVPASFERSRGCRLDGTTERAITEAVARFETKGALPDDSGKTWFEVVRGQWTRAPGQRQ